MKFVLLVEGPTEQRALPGFLKRWLDTKLEERVGIQAVRFEGWSDFVRKIVIKARMHLEGPSSQDILGAIGLLDLYGPTIFPDGLSVSRRYEWERDKIERDVNHRKFRMFFAVHEIEAWILSQPEILPAGVSKGLPGQARDPESVNSNQPPAKLLDLLYQRHTGGAYKKVVYGGDLFRELHPIVAFDKCPRLAEMLTEMRDMATRHGIGIR